MYLQVRRRKLKRRPGVTLEFVLIESVWDLGRMVKKFIKYLGSIKEADIPNMAKRVILWDKINMALFRLDLPENERDTFERLLGEIVPKPNKQDRDRYFEKKASMLADDEAEKENPGRPGPKGKRNKMVVTRRY